MYLFLRILGYFFLFVEKLKGRRVVREIVFHTDDSQYLEVVLTDGSVLKIYCAVRLYRREYDHWLVPHDHKTVYQLSSTISETASAELKQASDFKVDIPSLLPESMPCKYKRTAVLHAYLDIMLHRLERIRNGLPP